MAQASLDKIKQLRELTQAPVLECRNSLEQTGGDFKKAQELLKKKFMDKASRKKGRETPEGLIECYIHANGKIGALVELLCETDFVAKTSDFKNLCHELCLQIAAMNPKNTEELLKQTSIRDPNVTISDMIKGLSGKLGENITLKRFFRLALGE